MRSFLIVPVFLGLIFGALITYHKTPEAYYLTGFLAFICLAIQMYRPDKVFVYNHIYQPNSELFSEYFLITFPFAVSSLFTSSWFCYILLLLSVYLITFIKTDIKQVTYLRQLSSIIPAQHFEIISGFRKSFIFIIPCYILAIGFCWFTILPLFLLWFITITMVSFYDECEPLIILKEGNLQPKIFLNQKLIQHCKYLVLLFTPLLVVNTFFNFDNLLINLLFIPIQLALLCFAICFKYTLYQPNINLKANSIVLTLVSMCSIMPFLLPIPLLMAIYYYPKAKNNLNYYLND
jgi:hypothetical protein